MRKRNAKRYLQAEEIFVPQSSVEGEASDVNYAAKICQIVKKSRREMFCFPEGSIRYFIM